jgi:hypothetical protein
MAGKDDDVMVTLLSVRLSFASLFEPNRQKNEDGTERETWKSNFLIGKDDAKNMQAVYMGKRMPILAALKAASNAAKTKKWGDEKKWPKLKPEKLFLRDGDLEDWDGYAGNFYVSANAPLDKKPGVVTNRKDASNRWIEAEPGGRGAPYSGCYVNAVIRVWAQDNEHGKRVNSELKTVQFVKDGESFGAAPVDPNEMFSDDMVGEEGSIGDDAVENEDEGEDMDGLV